MVDPKRFPNDNHVKDDEGENDDYFCNCPQCSCRQTTLKEMMKQRDLWKAKAKALATANPGGCEAQPGGS